METLVKIVDRIVGFLVGVLGAALFFTIGIVFLLSVLAKGFIRSVKERRK